MTGIVVDGRRHEVADGANLLEALLGLGYDLPYFCWHPALGSVGACRQCAVEVVKKRSHDHKPELVMACMTPAAEVAEVSITAADAVEFRARVIEWLMLNHPHDCPVCDEGGECHLQDMTVMTGHAYRRSRFPKRTYRSQYLGPLVHHEMNRCIQCYRCVRFYRDYAGGDDLDVFSSHDHVFFGRERDGVLESPFAGNLVEVCPTGVFTDARLKRHYSRKWDLQSAPSLCQHCGLGCNTLLGTRYGAVRRVLNRYHHDVNGYFLCDRGRFGWEYLGHEGRLSEPTVASAEGPRTASPDDALARAAELLAGCDRVLGVASGRASLESAFVLRRLVGPPGLVRGTSRAETEVLDAVLEVLRAGPAPAATLAELEHADAVLVLGEDLTATAPRAALAVRQAVRQEPLRRAEALGVPPWHDAAARDASAGDLGPLFVASPARTALDDVARRTLRAVPDEIARLGLEVAACLEGGEAGHDELAEAIAGALAAAERPVVIAGAGCGSTAVVAAAGAVARALFRRCDAARVLLTVSECNSMGLALLGGPGLDALEAALDGAGRVGLVVVENDLHRHLPAETAERVLERCAAVIAVDHVTTRTTRRADVVLPAATFADGSGTVVSGEGRAQRFFRALEPSETVESWRWLAALAARLHGGPPPPETLDEVIAAMVAELPVLAGVEHAAPTAHLRGPAGGRFPRQSPRFSGRTAMHADRDVREPRPPAEIDSALAFSMEGSRSHPPAALIPLVREPGWNSAQAVNAYQREIAGRLAGGPAGRRLIEPGGAESEQPSPEPPPAWRRREGRWLAIPLHHVFGSEELSRLAPGVAELAPAPYVGLAEGDAARLGVGEGDAVRVRLDGADLELPARLGLGLPEGAIGLPVGLEGLPHADLPAEAAIERARG